MNKRSVRLKPIEKLAEDKEKLAVTDMLLAREEQHSQQKKLNELVQYRAEYIEQFQSRGKQGMQANQVQQYQQFIHQLDLAIKQQKITLKRTEQVLDERQNQWLNKNSHKRAMNKVVSRYQKEESQALDNTEQRDNDERNTQIHNQKNQEK